MGSAQPACRAVQVLAGLTPGHNACRVGSGLSEVNGPPSTVLVLRTGSVLRRVRIGETDGHLQRTSSFTIGP